MPRQKVKYNIGWVQRARKARGATTTTTTSTTAATTTKQDKRFPEIINRILAMALLGSLFIYRSMCVCVVGPH